MGVLETLMWCAGAGGLLAFWLWSGPSDIPASGRTTIERSRAAVRRATANVRPDPNIEVLQDHSRAERIKALQDREPDPISTGSASPAPLVAHSVDSPNTGSALAQPGEGAADGHAAVAAETEIDPQEESVELGRPAEDAAIEGPMLLQAAIPLPSQPLALDLFGLPFLETVSRLQEGIVLEAPIAPVPAEAPPDKMNYNQAQPAQVTIPEVQIAVAEVIASSSRETSGPQVQMAEQRPEPSESKSVDRDFLVRRGEGLLAQGDVAGARLFFGRAAADGDPRGATGMARTFDPETLRKLRVLGIRPDPEQAAQWYARSKVMQAVASTR